MILVVFYDKDVISTLLAAFTLKPHKIYMLYDSKLVPRKFIRNIKEAITAKLRHVNVVNVECDAYSTTSVQSAFNLIKSQNPGHDIFVDVKGGPEMMVAVGVGYAYSKGAIPVYHTPDEKYLFQVYDKNVKYKAARIRINDYLRAVGAKQFANSHDMPMREEFPMLQEMAELIFDNMNGWSRLQKFFEEVLCGEDNYEFTFDSSEIRENCAGEMQFLVDSFKRLGFIIQHSKYDYEVVSHKYKQYITNYGIWLELYTYINACALYDEVYLGFVIDWDCTDLMASNDNEIDVIVMENNRPVFISCKQRKPESKDLTEVGFLAKRFGGDKAKAVLATTYPVRENGDARNSVYVRLKKFGIGLIEVKDFKKREAAEIFEEAFSAGTVKDKTLW